MLSHGVYIMGPEVYQLEKKLAEYIGTSHCISCASGTDALLIPLMAKGIGRGDAVITSPFTYIATAEVIALIGAKPVFVDIYPNTYNMDPSKLEIAIKKARKENFIPKAVIPVDLFGLPARHRLISKIAEENDLFFLDDFAQGFGGQIRGKKVGVFGDVSGTSFFPAKPLGCYGDGGAIFTNNDKLADIMKSIRLHGGGSNKYENIRLGINGRLDTIQAAILLEKLAIFDNEVELRNQIAHYYTKNISNEYQKPFVPKGYLSSWAQYSLLAKSYSHRSKIIASLKKQIFQAWFIIKLLSTCRRFLNFLGYRKGQFPIAEDCAKRIFSLPMHPYLEIADQNKIIEVLNNE